ncbi:MAG: 3-hydroxyacyl-CoA dehydrogenase, partial [Mesorhizobium sp.]
MASTATSRHSEGAIMANVAIVGSGFIGRAWAISFARAGHDMR